MALTTKDLERDKNTAGIDKIHPTDTKSEAAIKLNEAHAERVGASGPGVAAEAKETVKAEVAAKNAEDRKDIVEDNEKNALHQPEKDERVKKNQEEAEHRRVEAAGAFDTPVFATEASCQTCADFVNGYRNDQPCGHKLTEKQDTAAKATGKSKGKNK